jgi:DNA-binding response OmpR family regulator
MSSDKSKKILVVDDEADILELLKYNLKKEGYHVKAVSNGVAAVETAKSFFPDLVLLDIMMPHQDGVETCRQLEKFLNWSILLLCFSRPGRRNILKWRLSTLELTIT